MTMYVFLVLPFLSILAWHSFSSYILSSSSGLPSLLFSLCCSTQPRPSALMSNQFQVSISLSGRKKPGTWPSNNWMGTRNKKICTVSLPPTTWTPHNTCRSSKVWLSLSTTTKTVEPSTVLWNQRTPTFRVASVLVPKIHRCLLNWKWHRVFCPILPPVLTGWLLTMQRTTGVSSPVGHQPFSFLMGVLQKKRVSMVVGCGSLYVTPKTKWRSPKHAKHWPNWDTHWLDWSMWNKKDATTTVHELNSKAWWCKHEGVRMHVPVCVRICVCSTCYVLSVWFVKCVVYTNMCTTREHPVMGNGMMVL